MNVGSLRKQARALALPQGIASSIDRILDELEEVDGTAVYLTGSGIEDGVEYAGELIKRAPSARSVLSQIQHLYRRAGDSGASRLAKRAPSLSKAIVQQFAKMDAELTRLEKLMQQIEATRPPPPPPFMPVRLAGLRTIH